MIWSVPEGKLLGAKDSTIQPTYGAVSTPVFAVFKPGLHLWKASALTTAYPLLPLSVVNRPLR